MVKTHSESPYYDLYDSSKNYVQMLAVPGRSAQAREFTELGTVNLDFIGRLGDAIFTNGAVISGCSIVISGTTVHITKGSIWLDGLVRYVDEVTLTITGLGVENIGATVVRSVVTEETDSTLNDPAQGMDNYGESGCHRVKEVVTWAVGNTDYTTIFRLDGGALVKEKVQDEGQTITDTLARRTYDESGNYKVNGLTLSARNLTLDNKIVVALSAGKAYIQGYEVVKDAITNIGINYSTTTRNVLNEPKIYSTSETDYKLNNQPVSDIARLTGVVQVTENVTRGTVSGGKDTLTNGSVVSIVSVTYGNTTYTQGTDYQLTTDSVDWSLLKQAPAIGAQYTVVYNYNKVLLVDTDYQLITKQGENYIRLKEGGTKPVDSTSMLIDYNFYLYRKDLITLNSDGDYLVIEGKPETKSYADSPVNQDPLTLTIGTICVYPNSDTVDIVNKNSTRLTQEQLFSVKKRVDNLEYNLAITDLDREAMDGMSPTDLKGVYTDGFIGFSKCDLGNAKFDATLDIEEGSLQLPLQQGVHSMTKNTADSSTNIAEIGRLWTSPYTETIVVNQSNGSDIMLVNPYAVYSPMVLVELEPEVDNWVESEYVEVEDTATNTLSLRLWWYHRNESWADSERKKWIALGYSEGIADVPAGSTTKFTIESTTTSESVIESIITYMRTNTITVTGKNFLPYIDNVTCYFNGVQINITPVSGYDAGTTSGTLKANASGIVKGTITVPDETPCGSVSIQLYSTLGEGSAVYSANGKYQTITNTVLTTKTTIQPVDPLAQSFGFDEDIILTSAEVYFATKDPTKSITVQIRGMSNGYPNTTCYDAVNVSPENINISDTGTISTKITFNTPMYCEAGEQYALCILSDSNNYSVFTGVLGNKDKITGNVVSAQPYETGVLFSSSNALTWTAHQDTDLKMKLNRANFTSDGCVVFNDITNVRYTELVLAAQAHDLSNANVEWLYQANNSGWLPIETYSTRSLGVIGNTIKLKCNLKRNGKVSPIVANDCINLVGFITKKQGAYVSKNTEFTEAYTNLRVQADIFLPTGTSVNFYYKAEDRSTDWIPITTNPTTTELSVDGWFRKGFSIEDISNQPKKYRIKVSMDTTSELIQPKVCRLMSILTY